MRFIHTPMVITSVLALSLAFSEVKAQEIHQDPLTEIQDHSDSIDRKLKSILKRSHSVQRKLENLSEDLQLEGVDRQHIKASIRTEQKNLTKISTQMAILEEDLLEEQHQLEAAIKFAKSEKDKAQVKALQGMKKTLNQQGKKVASAHENAQGLLLSTNELLAAPAPTAAKISVPLEKVEPVELLAQPKRPPAPIAKPKAPAPIAKAPERVATDEPSPIAETSQFEPAVEGSTQTSQQKPVQEDITLSETKPSLPIADKTVVANPSVDLNPQEGNPEGSMQLAEEQPQLSNDVQETQASAPIELTAQSNEVIVAAPEDPIEITAQSDDDDFTKALQAAGAQPTMDAIEELPTAEALVPTSEINRGNVVKEIELAEDFTPHPPAETAPFNLRSQNLEETNLPAPDEGFERQQALISALPDLESPGSAQETIAEETTGLVDTPQVAEKKPLRTLGQPIEEYESQLAKVEQLENITPDPTAINDTSYNSPPLAVLSLEQGAAGFKWYVFSAINRGLYKNPDMEFDIVEYSADANSSSAKEVEGILISLGLEPSQLHVRHAGADDGEPRIQIYPSQ